MRAFLGLSPDAKTKLAIDAWRHKSLPQFNAPVPAANFHVTLAFLGQVTAKHLDSINTEIENMPDIAEFDVTLDQVGYWPKPKAFWLGCQNSAEQHKQLAKQLHKIAKIAGLNLPKHPYIPHLTLARKCNENPPAPLIQPNFNWRAKEFHLYESVSSSHGVAYHIRQSWPLKMSFSFNR
ncbi:RNA 2',3'-cyclic phosphodiesterase [Paraglaciecola aquimarina]|uniref:RNA 2',3'-cyclic phosphodiesterase n=1 Tax=Paraglaciecola algarum TaxID=3050085 RepID=A0ABS9D8S7_9ALTE|nr:RNA 2',3'-cyclic phosphodiesterase [Paraglaciecola sp. G1-23]MCF2948780.1 RNA 2',3'-cyclic phosphodiesterase [Paraglaciecola sp. G1-23]